MVGSARHTTAPYSLLRQAAATTIQRAWRAHDARNLTYRISIQIAAAKIIQKAWRLFRTQVRHSAEWAQRYHPLRAQGKPQPATQVSEEQHPPPPGRVLSA